jgi:hypothetical protein
MTNVVAGLEVEFSGKPFWEQVGYGTKVFYYDKEGNKVELQDVIDFSIPKLGMDDLLYATITLPLLNIKYQGESK